MRFCHPLILVFFLVSIGSQAATQPDAPPSPHVVPANRVASIYVSESFINEQLAEHSKSELIKEMKIELDPMKDRIYLRGILQVPIEELRAVNLDPALGAFRFQMAVKAAVTKKGHLILDFPLAETFFYPANSKDPQNERVIVPVQLLSLALASARGYLAALSGDFSGFDRRTEKLTALMKSLDRSIKYEKNPDAREELKTQREAYRLQLAAVPIERKQLETLSKEVSAMLGFTGEKEININNELAAKKNALILKVKLAQLAPYLANMEFGGIRILDDKKDGTEQKYLALDLTGDLATRIEQPQASSPHQRTPLKIPPSLIMRLNQSLFESTEVVDAEKEEMGSKLKNMKFELKDDGLHVSGAYHTFLFLSVPFETTVDFVSTDVDVFEIRVRDLSIAGIDFEFMTKFVLESMKRRLNHAMKGICKFKYVGEEKDHSRALRVTIDPKAMIPAFPDLHLVSVDVRDREFLLKIGKI